MRAPRRVYVTPPHTHVHTRNRGQSAHYYRIHTPVSLCFYIQTPLIRLLFFFFLMIRRPRSSPLFPYPPLFRSSARVALPPLRLASLVGGRRELALGQSVHAVVLEDVGHVRAAPHDVRELPQANRRRVAVAGHEIGRAHV